jgi:outer membrane biosynthesis protein TonB
MSNVRSQVPCVSSFLRLVFVAASMASAGAVAAELSLTAASPPSPSASSSSAATSNAACAPEPLAIPHAAYPGRQLVAGNGGTVYFRFLVLSDGSIGEVQALPGSTKEFIPETFGAVRGWKFKPLRCPTSDGGMWLKSFMKFQLE